MAMKILVTDDDPDGAFATQTLLERMGHHVVVTHDGAAALKQVSFDKPDLVLLDLNLPDTDGYKICTEMRKSPALRNTPIFAFTGLENPKVAAEAKAAGFTDVLIKSMNFDNVREKVSYIDMQNNALPVQDAQNVQEELSELKAASESKALNITQIVHDLRGPLHTISSCLELLESGFKKPEDIIGPMRRSTNALTKIVEHLRDINH